jgi:hypothetical protein
MESFVNQPFLAKRAKFGRWGSFVGLGALILGVMVTTRSPLAAYGLLLIGLLGATFGSYMANPYVREPRADQVLAKAMEGLDKRYALYSYYFPSHHVIASHYGLLVAIPRAQEGQVWVNGGQWRHKAGWRKLLQLFGEPGVGRPDQDAIHEAGRVKEWIEKLLPDNDVPVLAAVVFTNPKVELHVSAPTVPTMSAPELADYMRQGLKGQPTLSTATQKELRRTLDGLIAEA